MTKIVHSEMIAKTLEAEIVAGNLPPGARLDEISLTKRFNVSRTPIREALHVLVSRSLAERINYKGVVVKDITLEQIASMFEAMAEIEAICGGLAAMRMTTKELSTIHQQNKMMDKLARQNKFEDYERENTNFHIMIYEGSHNENLADMAKEMRLKLAPFRSSQLRTTERISQSNNDHKLIVNLLETHNKPGTEQALRNHLLGAHDAVIINRA